MADTQEFFDERQGAAVIKHGILRRYLPVFAAKTGSTSAGGRVVYLDGYAGAGGSTPSPSRRTSTRRMISAARSDTSCISETIAWRRRRVATSSS